MSFMEDKQFKSRVEQFEADKKSGRAVGVAGPAGRDDSGERRVGSPGGVPSGSGGEEMVTRRKLLSKIEK